MFEILMRELEHITHAYDHEYADEETDARFDNANTAIHDMIVYNLHHMTREQEKQLYVAEGIMWHVHDFEIDRIINTL